MPRREHREHRERRDHYWLTDDSAPYAILLRLIETYCHPSAWDGAYDQLRALAQRTDDLEMRVFKRQLTAVITKPDCLPKWVLNAAADYDDGKDEAFLARLWQDLYPAEPLPTL